tara:strand:+ start:753 stop:1295 length:543 start_codon:yes stop_codon:yes gene_type:complete
LTSCCGCDIIDSINKIRKEDKIMTKVNKLTDSWEQDKLIYFRTIHSELMEKSKEELIEMIRTGDKDIYKVLNIRSDKFMKMYAKIEKDSTYKAYAKGDMSSVWTYKAGSNDKDIRWNKKLHGMLPNYESWHYANKIDILIGIGIDFVNDVNTEKSKHQTIVTFLMKSYDSIMDTNKYLSK